MCEQRFPVAATLALALLCAGALAAPGQESEGLFTPPRRTTAQPSRDLAGMVAAAESTYRPGPVLARHPGDNILYRGPFVLRKSPALAEHKPPWEFGRPIRAVDRLRLYPFLAFDAYLDVGDRLQKLATNFVYNSLQVTPAIEYLEVPVEGGLGYVEVPRDDGTTEKYLVVRLRDLTLKVTRIGDSDGVANYSVYCISGRVWARYAQHYIPTSEPLTMTVYPTERSNPREGRHLRQLLEGMEDRQYRGYWTLPEREHLRGNWGEIWMPGKLRAVGADGAGETVLTPIDIGYFDIVFEEGLTYTGEGYSPRAQYHFPLFFPQDEVGRATATGDAPAPPAGG
jgi:hypothetical protein